MKKITVGRGNDCDIVIPDERDNVSRHHMVISFNLLGKMTISDTSSNGTFINERRMLKGTSIPVTRNDKIRLGDRWNFDWNLVKDPYVTMRKTIIAAASLLVVVIIAAVWLMSAGQAPAPDQQGCPHGDVDTHRHQSRCRRQRRKHPQAQQKAERRQSRKG